jgi:cold shock protein
VFERRGQGDLVAATDKWGVIMAKGRVKWFNTKKGFGFIEPSGGGEDCFVHYTQVTGSGFRTLEDGVTVEFELTQGNKGCQAENVVICDEA